MSDAPNSDGGKSAIAVEHDCPNYDVEVDADELLTDLAEKASFHGKQAADCRRSHREHVHLVLDLEPGQLSREQLEELEHMGALRAFSDAIAMLQPESAHWKNFRESDDIDVRGFMREISRLSKREHEARHGKAYKDCRQPQGAHSAYSKILSLLREDYGVGWPRLDDVGGNPLEEDLP